VRPRPAGPGPALAALAAAGLAALLLAPAARAAEVALHEVQLPDRGTVDIPFVATVRAPAGAELEGEARAEAAGTRLSISWKRMKPALLFGGNVTSYVAWAVAKDGAVERLGELFVKDPRGTATFATARRAFGLVVTAEPHPGVGRPSGVVVFTGGVPKPGKARSEPFSFGRFSSDAKPATPSVASLEWTGGEPLELAQARALLALAEAAKSGDPDQGTLREARAALGRAEAPVRGTSPAAALGDARRAGALASEALQEAERRRAAEEAARLETERRAREAAAKAAAADEADRRRQAEAALAEVEELRQKTAADRERARQAAVALAVAEAGTEQERKRLVEEQEALRRERAAVAARLDGALERVAPTARTGRGLVVTLPGTSFETGKASLQGSARAAVAKLAGILLMVPELNVRVEGHTDSTGGAAANLRLSEERARNVADLLREQGVAGERLAFEGYGATNPVAPNTTAAGRALNRRVEIVLGEGEVEAAPAGDGTPAG